MVNAPPHIVTPEEATAQIMGVIQNKENSDSFANMLRRLDQRTNLLPPIRNESPTHLLARKKAAIAIAVNALHEEQGSRFLVADEDNRQIFLSISLQIESMNTHANSARWAAAITRAADNAPTPVDTTLDTASAKVMELLKTQRIGGPKGDTYLEKMHLILAKHIENMSDTPDPLPERIRKTDRMIALAVNQIHEAEGPTALLALPDKRDILIRLDLQIARMIGTEVDNKWTNLLNKPSRTPGKPESGHPPR